MKRERSGSLQSAKKRARNQRQEKEQTPPATSDTEDTAAKQQQQPSEEKNSSGGSGKNRRDDQKPFKNGLNRFKQKGIRDTKNGTTGVPISEKDRKNRLQFSNLLNSAISVRQSEKRYLPDKENILTNKRLNNDKVLQEARSEEKEKQIKKLEEEIKKLKDKEETLIEEEKKMRKRSETTKKDLKLKNSEINNTQADRGTLNREIAKIRQRKLENFTVDQKILDSAIRRQLDKIDDQAVKGHQISDGFGGGATDQNVVSTTYWQEQKQTAIENAINQVIKDYPQIRENFRIKHTVYAYPKEESVLEIPIAAKYVRYKVLFNNAGEYDKVLDELIPDDVYQNKLGEEASTSLKQYKHEIKQKLNAYLNEDPNGKRNKALQQKYRTSTEEVNQKEFNITLKRTPSRQLI